VEQHTKSGLGRLKVKFSRSRTIRQANPTGLSERLISSSQRLLLTQHKTNTTDKHPCPQWDSNPQPRQWSGRRPTPETARLPYLAPNTLLIIPSTLKLYPSLRRADEAFNLVSISITNLIHLFIKSYYHSHLKLHTLQMPVRHN
jgi:hypothetical protein